MLEEIHQNGGDADKYMAKAKDKDDPFRLMGLGIEYIKTLIHVLKSSKAADEVLETLGVDDPILAIAKKLSISFRG
jgi:citrate synthase